ncbi:MAG TPA: NADH-quinone oxidoreductase subunit J [Thermoanaerobaculia bacterium]|nr:NADH-quinone oxidoreductase subunit J [Thermoanaerobaculia bacterium]
MELLVFLIFAFLAVAASLVVVAHKNPVYSTMALVVTLFAVAVLFVLLGAPFIGVLQVLIYTGAIVVLFLFVIMLLNIGREESQLAGHKAQFFTAIFGTVLFGGLVILALSSVRMGAQSDDPSLALVSLKGLATTLFTEYLLPFEIIGLLLLVAVIGATVAARRPPQSEGPAIASGFEPRVDPVRSTPHEEPQP